MHKQFNLYLLSMFLVMIFWAASCQEPAEEISPPDSQTAFAKGSDLGNYVAAITMLDGSYDNVIDNASCLTVRLPVEVVVKGTPVTVNSEQDVLRLVEKYNENPYGDNFLTVTFPISVRKADWTEVEIGSQRELESLGLQCQEGGSDADIECIDFGYPLTVSTYNTEFQKAGTSTLTSDEALFYLIGNLSDKDYAAFDFPLTVTSPDGDLSVEQNSELVGAIERSLNACDENDHKFYTGGGGGGGLEFGVLSLIMTDAPFPIGLVEEANVAMTRIEVKTGEENDTVPFITLTEEEKSFNLVTLTNGVTTTLTENKLPAGTYDQIRVYVEKGSVLLTDGTLYDLKIPSGSQSGIKLKPASPITITKGDTTRLLLDFDLSRSFVVQGNPNKPGGIKGFILKPVIKISNLGESGILKGKVADATGNPLKGAQMTVYAADTVNTTTFTAESGEYKILGLAEGLYRIEVEFEDYEPVSIDGIEIVARKETIQDIFL